MALTPRDILIDVGEIDGVLFWPKLTPEEVDVKVQGYLDDPRADLGSIADPAKRLDAQREWAYYRARDAVLERLTIDAAATGVGAENISASWTADQRARLAEKAADNRAAYQAIYEEAIAVDEAVVVPLRSSMSAPARFVW